MPADILYNATMPRRRRVPGLADPRTPPMAYDALVLSDSPEAFWKLNELSGTTAVDATGNGHNGTYNGSYTLGAVGLIDYAVSLPGGAQTAWVSVSDATNMPTTGNYTIEAIVFCLAANAIILSYGNGVIRQSVYFYAPSTSSTIGVSWFAGDEYIQSTDGYYFAWHHVATTWDGSLRRLYIDGILQGSGNTPGGTPNFSQNALTIGAAFQNQGQVWNGRLQRVAIYNTALSAAKLLAHKKAAFGW
jgi:hypothetical protein